MVTKEFTNATHQQTGSMLNMKLLGTLGILASPIMLVEGLIMGFEQHGTTPLIGLLEVFYIIGWMSSIVGLRWAKATGQGRPGQAILIVQLVGLFIAGAWSAYHLVPNPNTTHFFYLATDFSWPFSHLFMIVVGIATLRAKTWTGWPRFSPLLCGLALMTQHLTNPEIAERLAISQKTVRNQVSNILSKLQVVDRAQAIIRAREAGLGL